MGNPSVIDANCLKYFQEERLSDENNEFSKMIEKAIAKGFIAIDDEGKAQQEYSDCCKPSAVGLNLCDWIADQIVNNTFRMFSMDRSLEKDLKSLGLPKKDLKWPAIAKGAKADIILTEDIDLFEPKAKSYASKKKEKIKSAGGCVSKYLAKKHEIVVITTSAFLAE